MINSSSWQQTTTGALCEYITSGSRDWRSYYSDSGAIFVRTQDINKDRLDLTNVAFVKLPERIEGKRSRLQGGDLLVTITGANVGKVAIVPDDIPEAYVSQSVGLMRLKDKRYAPFLYHFLQSEETGRKRLLGLVYGIGRPVLSLQNLREVPVSLPSLEEQRRIVAEIEKQFTRLDAGVAALRRVQANLKRYRAAVLKAACEGRLVPTEADLARREGRNFETGEQLLQRILTDRRRNWAGRGKYNEPKGPKHTASDVLPAGWTWATFEQLSERVTVGFVGSMKHEYVASGIPFLRGQNVRENRFCAEGLLYVSRAFHDSLPKSALRPGDLAVVRSGAVGVTCVIPPILKEANCSDLVLVQRPLGIVPQYGAYYMNSLAKRHVEAGKVGVALTHFNTKSVAALVVPLPPIDEQERIVAEVERRLSVIDKLEAVVTANLACATRLRQSVLHEMFGRDFPVA